MFGKMKIKTRIALTTTFILGIIILLQITLYSILQKENHRVISSVFESVTQNTVQQIDKLNENIAESTLLLAVHRTVQASLYEYSPAEIVRNSDTIQSLLSDYLDSNHSIAYLGIIKEKRLFMSSERSLLYENVRSIISSLPKSKNSHSVFVPSFEHEGSTYFTCVTPVFPIKADYYSKAGMENYIVCVYEMDSINFVPSGAIDNDTINLVITDSQNRIMLSSNSHKWGEVFDFTEIDKNFLQKTLPLSDADWNVTAYMPSQHTTIFSKLTLFFIVFMIVFTLAMLVLMLILLNNTIVKRIEILKKSVEKISTSDTDYRIEYKYDDEFSTITTSINKVLDIVHSLNLERIKTMDNLFRAELLQKETRIFYLYGQVSPHFLYNSLTHIQGLAFKYNAPPIAKMVQSLSKVFRYYSNNRTLSTIKQDLECAIEYFNTINTRRTNPITLINNVDSSLDNIKCLKMIYQPILENTLKHAYGLDNSGTVVISSTEHPSKAIIEITDDGSGIPTEKLKSINTEMLKDDLIKIQNSDHVGITNVNMRLKLYYNSNDSGIEIFSKKGKGTTVRITFEKEIPSEA